MAQPTRTLLAIAEEVKNLHDQDDALSKVRAKTKVEQRQIRLRVGELVAGVIGTIGAEHLSILAERSGYTVGRLRDFALVRAAWPDGTFPADANYTALEELARDPDRFSKVTAGMTKRDARAAKGGKVDTPSRWSSGVKADFVAEALRDPEVRRELNTRRIAREDANARRLAQLEAGLPGARASRQDTEEAVGLHELAKANVNLRDALSAFAAVESTPRQTAAAADLLDTAERYIAALRELLASDGLDAVEAFANTGGTQ